MLLAQLHNNHHKTIRNNRLAPKAVAPKILPAKSSDLDHIVAPVAGSAGIPANVFLFFSSRLGCLGSLVISLALTALLLFILGVL